MASYIYVKTGSITSEEGYIINISLENALDFASGIDTVDLSIVQTTSRSLMPTSGLKQDFDFDFELIDDGQNKCFQVDNIGNLTPLTKFTTKDQLNFLLESVITNEATARYFVYNEWLDKTIQGHLVIRGRATGDAFFTKVNVRATLKAGVNTLAIFGG